MPLIWPLIAVFSGGAFVGAQVNQSQQQPTNSYSLLDVPSTGKIIACGAVAVAAYIAYKKFK